MTMGNVLFGGQGGSGGSNNMFLGFWWVKKKGKQKKNPSEIWGGGLSIFAISPILSLEN